MKKQFSKLNKTAQEDIELAYHQMNPHEFDEQMMQAKRHSPELLRLSPQLVERLRKKAESAGETEYQTMVNRWIEERLHQETMAA